MTHAARSRERDLLHEVATSPLTLDDDDLDYVELMIGRDLWNDITRTDRDNGMAR